MVFHGEFWVALRGIEVRTSSLAEVSRASEKKAKEAPDHPKGWQRQRSATNTTITTSSSNTTTTTTTNTPDEPGEAEWYNAVYERPGVHARRLNPKGVRIESEPKAEEQQYQRGRGLEESVECRIGERGGAAGGGGPRAAVLLEEETSNHVWVTSEGEKRCRSESVEDSGDDTLGPPSEAPLASTPQNNRAPSSILPPSRRAQKTDNWIEGTRTKPEKEAEGGGGGEGGGRGEKNEKNENVEEKEKEDTLKC
ncbi:hypothetical protein TCAL_17271 [Tigriopus californicus]|uniref:Uncharacterized protein n=1 Tax=Tigriopus californicus TaxID=6832 RepID=A0A553NXN2_TIGCA|nr:hypothetical protein TCAL_17271 [Tigriopus californicus]